MIKQKFTDVLDEHAASIFQESKASTRQEARVILLPTFNRLLGWANL
jgi:hypothetical protein